MGNVKQFVGHHWQQSYHPQRLWQLQLNFIDSKMAERINSVVSHAIKIIDIIRKYR